MPKVFATCGLAKCRKTKREPVAASGSLFCAYALALAAEEKLELPNR
jgi:hypothetical protein